MKLYPVRLSRRAERDLEQLEAWITERAGPKTAERYVGRLEPFLTHLEVFPERGTLRNELGRGLRTLGYKRSATIVFRVTQKEVVMARVLRGRQDIRRAMRG